MKENINVNKIISAVTSIYPNNKVMAIYDYDDDAYLVATCDKKLDPHKDFVTDMYKLVQKSTGKMRAYTPTEDFDKFDDAVDNRKIYG